MNEFWGRPLLSSVYLFFLLNILNKTRHLLKIPIQSLGWSTLMTSWFEILHTTTVLTLCFPQGGSRQAYHATLATKTHCFLFNNVSLHLYKMLLKVFSHTMTFSNIPVCPLLTFRRSLHIGKLSQRFFSSSLFDLPSHLADIGKPYRLSADFPLSNPWITLSAYSWVLLVSSTSRFQSSFKGRMEGRCWDPGIR